MNLRSQIKSMLDTIGNYNGNFGDPIATEFTFNPYVEIKNSDLEDSLVLGMGVAYLVNFAVCIDNNNYESALKSIHAVEIKEALNNSVFSKYQYIENALRYALISEDGFNKSTNMVYQHYILRR